MPIKILAIFSAPRGAQPLNIRLEKETLIDASKNSEYGHLFEITPVLHITLPKFKELLKNDYQLIHFSGHSYEKYIIFEKIDGTRKRVPIDAFIKLIKKKKQSPDKQLKCMIFNSCSSSKLGEELSKLGICTISMKSEIKETAARLFTEGFYSEFSNESTILDMFENAQNNIHLDNLHGWEIPVLKGDRNLKFEVIEIPKIPPDLRLCIEDERNPDFVRVNEVYMDPKRFEDALEILTRNRFLIITGPPNIGKTSTAYKLANTIKQDNREINLIFSIKNKPIEHLKELKNSIIIFDDVFGQVKFTNESQANDFNEYQKLVKSKNYLIYTTREEILLMAKESRTKFSEYPDLEQYTFRIEPEVSYDDTTLKKILKKHLNHYFKQDIISKNEIEIAEDNLYRIIEKLRFPHNYKELVEKELYEVSKNRISIEEAIDKAKHIKRSVYQWFTNMEDISMKFFIFTLALFQDLNLNDIEFNKIYSKVIELLKKRYSDSDLKFFRIETLLENPLISTYIRKKGDFIDFIHPHYLEGVNKGIFKYCVEDIITIEPLLKEIIVDENVHIRSDIAYTLGEIGKVAPELVIPLLREMMKDEHSYVLRSVAKALGKIGTKEPELVIPLLKEMMRDEDSWVRRSVAEALGKIGSKEPELVIPLLKEMINDKRSWVRESVVKSFGNIGTSEPELVILLLKELINDKRFWVRESVVKSFGNIGTSEPELIIPLLKEMINDKKSMVRKSVAEALGEIGKIEPDLVIPLLKETMKDKNRYVRKSVAIVLGKIGKKEPELVIHLLKEMMKDENSYVRKSVVEALGYIGTNKPELIILLLKEMMKEKNRYVRRSVAEAFGKIGKIEPELVILLLKEMMKDEDTGVRKSVLKSFGNIGTYKPELILHLLKEMMRDKDSAVQVSVAEALGYIGTYKPELVVPLLKEMMKEENSWVRKSVAEAFGKIGKIEPELIIHLLKEMMRDKDSAVQVSVAEVLGKIGTKEPEVVIPLLKEMINDKKSMVRKSVAEALGEIGKIEPDLVIPLLKETMKDKNYYVRESVAIVLGKISKIEPELVIHLLKETMKDKDTGVRKSVVKSFGKIGTYKPELIVLLLKEMMKDKDTGVRKSVAEAFGKIGKIEPELVVPLLKEMMKDEDFDVRAIVKDYIKKF